MSFLIGLLRFIRGVAGFVGAGEVAILLNALNRSGATATSAAGQAPLPVQVAIVVAAFALFFGLRALINRLHARANGAPHPALKHAWNL